MIKFKILFPNRTARTGLVSRSSINDRSHDFFVIPVGVKVKSFRNTNPIPRNHLRLITILTSLRCTDCHFIIATPVLRASTEGKPLLIMTLWNFFGLLRFINIFF